MSKNIKAKKINMGKKPTTQTSAKTTPITNNENSQSLNSVSDYFKEAAQNAMRGQASLCGYTPSTCSNIMEDMLATLSKHLRHNFEENLELSHSLLQSRTAADFVEFQRRNFEINFKNTTQMYEDLFGIFRQLGSVTRA